MSSYPLLTNLQFCHGLSSGEMVGFLFPDPKYACSSPTQVELTVFLHVVCHHCENSYNRGLYQSIGLISYIHM